MSNSINSWPIPAPLSSASVQLAGEVQGFHWFVVQTRCWHESVVAQQLTVRAIEHVLPVYQSRRHWKDRIKTLCMPLFPNYLFVRIQKSQFLRVLEISSVSRLVGSPRPQVLSESEIRQIQQWAFFPHLLEPHPYLHIGQRVRIRQGPMAGLDGVLVRKKNNLSLVVSVELIQRSVAVEIDAADVASC